MAKSKVPLDLYTACGRAEGFVEGTPEEVLEAWQFLVDTGIVWTLQGWFGRTARDLIEQGLITDSKAVANDNAKL